MASKSIEFDAVVSANQINRLLADLQSGAEGAAKAINDALGGSVTKKIVFEEVVNGNGVKQLVAVEKERLTIADQLINKQRQLDKTQQGSKTNLQQTLNTLRQQRDGVARYQTSINAVGQSIRVQRQEWTELNAKVSTVARQLDIASASGFWDQLKVSTNTQGLIDIGNGLVQITNQLQAASIIVGQFTGAINTLIDSAAQIQSFNLAFKAIGAGAAGGAKALQESSRIALGLGADLNTVQEGFKQLSPVVLNIGGTLGDVSGVIESLSSRFAAFGISGDRARRVTQGVIQAFAKGKLQAEELTQQISEADPAFKTDFTSALFAARSELGALGKQVDGSTANLEKLVKAGKITADVLLKVLPGISKSGFLFGKLGPTAGTAVDALEKGSVTIDQVRSNLKNLNQLSLRDLAKSAEPLINAFLRVQAVVVDFFSRITKSSAFEAFAGIAARIVESLGRLADVFFVVIEGALKFVEAIKPVLDLLAGIPGLTEIAGVALLGKLLGPLKLLDGKLGKVAVTWSNFINTVSGSPREAVSSVTNSIKQLQTQLLKPVKVNIDTANIAKGLTTIGSTVGDEAGRTIDQIGKTTDRINTKIERTEKRLSALRGKLETELDRSRQSSVNTEIQGPSVSEENRQKLIGAIASYEQEIESLQKKLEKASTKIDNSLQQTGLASAEVARRLEQGVSSIENTANIKVGRDFLSDSSKFAKTSSEELQSILKKDIKAFEELEAAAKEAGKTGDLRKFAIAAGFSERTFGSEKDFVKQGARSLQVLGTRISSIYEQLESRQKVKPIEVELRGEDLPGVLSTRIDELQASASEARKELAALGDAAEDDPGKTGLAVQETKRQKKLKEQIKKTANELQALYAEQASQGAALGQTRRQRVGFDPSAIGLQQKYVNLRREEIKQDILSKSAGFQVLEAREKTVRARLAAIEAERKSLSQAFPVLKPRSGEFRTDEVRKLKDELRNLTEEKGRFSAIADQASIRATDFARILEEGSSESSTFAQRQRALTASLGLSRTIVKQNATELKALRARYREVAAEGRALEKQRQDRPFAGLVPKNDPLTLGIAENREQRARIKGEIDAITGSSREALAAQRGLADALAENAKTAPLFTRLGTAIKSFSGGIRDSFVALRREGLPVIATAFGASFAKSSPILANFGKAGIGGITKALGPLKEGLAAIIGLIDPLTAAFIAFGIAARLYADGNKEAAQTAKDFKQTLDNLAATRKDILPGVAAPEKAETALDRAYGNITANTVSFVDGINAKLKELGNGFFGFFENIREGVPELKSGFVEVISSIALVSGAVVVGAKTALAVVGAAAAAGAATGAATGAAAGAVTGPGAAITAFTGAVIGATIAVAGLVAVTGDAAESKFQQLKKSLEELKTGAAATAEAIDSLSAGLLSDIELKTTGEISPENINRIKSALEAAKEVRNQIQNSLDAVAGRRQKGGEQIDQLEKEVKLEEEKLAQIRKQKEELQQVAKGPRGSVSPGDVAKLRELESEERRLADSIENKNGKIKITQRANGELEITIKSLSGNLETAANNVDKLSAKLTSAQINNIKYANTIGEINTAIKDLTEQNEGLKLTDPEDRKTLDDNLTKIKGFQAILEQISKTKYEVNIEVRNLRGAIAEAQTRIDIEPGDLRDTVTLARKTSDEIANAQDKYQQTIKGIEGLGKNIAPEDAAKQIAQAGLEFLGATRTGAANLIDAGRQLRDKLRDSQNSLSNLKLSNPNFFTPEELSANAQQIEESFLKALEKVRQETGNLNFFPKIEGDTPLEQLASKAKFVEVRTEADKLTESINEINVSIGTIIAQLSRITGIEIKGIKGGAAEVKKQIDLSRTSIEGLGAATVKTSRIGQVYGTISGGGQELAIYYDNVTRSVEQVTAAQFKARQEADKLIASGTQVGGTLTTVPGAAASKFELLGTRISRVGKVLGEISAGGKKQILFFDNLKGEVNSVDQATFDRLKKEKAITKEAGDQVAQFEQLLKLFQTQDAAAAARSARMQRQGQAGRSQFQGGVAASAPDDRKLKEWTSKLTLLAEQAGGDFVKTLQLYVENGENGLFSLGRLTSLQLDTKGYELAVSTLQAAQSNLVEKQKAYNKAVAAGSPEVTTLAAGLQDAKEIVAQSQLELDSWNKKIADTSRLARELGIDIRTIPDINAALSPQGQTASPLQEWNGYVDAVLTGTQRIKQEASSATFNPLVEAAKNATVQGGEVLQQWGTYLQEIESGARNIRATSSGSLLPGVDQAQSALQGAAGSSQDMQSNFQNVATSADRIADSLIALKDTTVTIGVNYKSPRALFTGGPVAGGEKVHVNELGQEGFLSASGKLSNINAPAYGLWRAPGAGTVVPAHIMDQLNVPQAGIKVNTGGKSVTSNNGMQQVMRAIFAAMSTSRTPENAINELANVQANQAVQIGKLSRVVNKLAEKDWSVNVNVRPSSSASFVDRLNHRL